MKNLVLMSALAAGLAAAAPSAAAAGPNADLWVNNGKVAGHLTLVDHERRYYRRDHRRGRRYCESWRRAHRKLHRRFDHVRLHRRVYNRRGHKVFIAHARNHHGRAVRVRYNACTRRITRVRRVGGHHRRYYRQYDRRYDRRNWRR